MLFLKTDFSTDTTELTSSQREDCLVSTLTLTFKIHRCCSSSMFPYICQTVKTSVVKVSMILLATRLNELKTLLANPQNIKTSQGMFWF